MKTLLTLLAFASITTFGQAQNCLDFSQYSQAYLDSVNVLPMGSTLFTEGDLEVIRPDQWSQYQFMQGDSLMYIGNLDLDASASTCANKQLTFKSIYMESIAVDGDTIFTSVNPPAFYQGAGWTFESTNMGTYVQYTITGDFDVANLMSSTNFIWDICLDCLSTGGSSNCLDFSQYSQAYLDSVNLLPMGSTLFTEGDLEVIRPDQWSQYQFMQGDSLMYIGNLDLDASASTCANKQLTFKSIYMESIAVDGDTIFTSVNPPAFYQGAGWTFESANMGTYVQYTITGDFDVANLMSSTNFIWDICLDCLAGLNDPQEMITFALYPNPADQWVTITSLKGQEYVVYSIRGIQCASGKIQGETTLDVSTFDAGMYIFSVMDQAGNKAVQKLQVR